MIYKTSGDNSPSILLFRTLDSWNRRFPQKYVHTII